MQLRSPTRLKWLLWPHSTATAVCSVDLGRVGCQSDLSDILWSECFSVFFGAALTGFALRTPFWEDVETVSSLRLILEVCRTWRMSAGRGFTGAASV